MAIIYSIFFVLILFILLYCILEGLFWFRKTKAKYSHINPLALTATNTIATPLLDRIVRRIARTRTRSSGRYKPGKLGLSAVSRAILKDYGSILSRKQRKYYSKAYGIPLRVYRF